MKNYTANMDSIGDWDGNEGLAVELWNEHIAPVLEAAHNYEQDDDQLQHDEQWAWEQFCEREAGDSYVRSMVLGNDLQLRLGGEKREIVTKVEK